MNAQEEISQLKKLLDRLHAYHAESCDLGYTLHLKDVHIKILKIGDKIKSLEDSIPLNRKQLTTQEIYESAQL